jgi:hypothetical protein
MHAVSALKTFLFNFEHFGGCRFSRFGVCCLFKVSAVSSTINQNNTYVQNPAFPAVYTGTPTTLSYKVQKSAGSNEPYLILQWKLLNAITNNVIIWLMSAN